jgi:hypothetical protein
MTAEAGRQTRRRRCILVDQKTADFGAQGRDRTTDTRIFRGSCLNGVWCAVSEISQLCKERRLVDHPEW